MLPHRRCKRRPLIQGFSETPPYKGKRSQSRTEYQRQSWFRRLQHWQAGQEGTISELKGRYGLNRTLYRGLAGCGCWIGGAIGQVDLKPGSNVKL
ncbi:MAG: transposase [Bacillota bacterium]